MTSPPGAAEDAAALARRLAALEEGPIRVRAAARLLAALSPERAVAAGTALAASADPRARAACAAVLRALADPETPLSYEDRAAIYAEAIRAGAAELAAALVSAPPARAFEPPRERDARIAALTLGHKKSLARGHRDPDLLARLAAEGEPSVVRELLANPLVTEAFAVRIAARRPCRPETLRLLADAPRWRTRPAVARAIARNPYAETEVAVRALALVPAADLAELAGDEKLHPLVRATAARLAGARRAG